MGEVRPEPEIREMLQERKNDLTRLENTCALISELAVKEQIKALKWVLKERKTIR